MTTTSALMVGLAAALLGCAGASTPVRTVAPEAAATAPVETPRSDVARPTVVAAHDPAAANASSAHDRNSLDRGASTERQGPADAAWTEFVKARIEHLREVTEKVKSGQGSSQQVDRGSPEQ